jgi:hypothetical protein
MPLTRSQLGARSSRNASTERDARDDAGASATIRQRSTPQQRRLRAAARALRRAVTGMSIIS